MRYRLLCAGCVAAAVMPVFNIASAVPFMAGADISALPVLEAGGAEYFSQGVKRDAIDILSSHGVGWYRLRLFVDPANDSDPFVVNDLDYTIALAQRVLAAGGKILLDFHYSDTWADPGKQNKPAGWSNLSFSQLENRVRDYSREAIEAFANQGVLPDMVQVGNEISNGMLWSDGYVWTGGLHDQGFDRLATLLEAGIDGVKQGAGPGHEPQIMIHHDRGHDWGATSYYFDKLVERNLDFDVIGYSYYPKFHYDPDDGSGSVADVAENFNNTALTYGKPVVLVETGFPYRGQQYEPDYEFAVSEQGQRAFLEAMIDTVEAVPNGLGSGVFWWYADATPVSGLPVWEGGRYGLFDQNGEILDAALAFEVYLPENLPGDFNGDGMVELADYTIWRESLGAIDDTPINSAGDGDQGVDQGDFEVWKTNFGSSSATISSTASTVHEPASMLLLLIGSTSALWASRRI